MKNTLLLLCFVLVAAAASSVTLQINEISAKNAIISGESFTLDVRYTIINNDRTSTSLNDLKLELALPHSVSGTRSVILDSISIGPQSTIMDTVTVSGLYANEQGENQRISVRLYSEDKDLSVISTYSFDILELPGFTVQLVPDHPAKGETVKVRGDVWPVVVDFVGKDVDGKDIILTTRQIGGEYEPEPVLILTDWGTFNTFTNQFGRFEYFIRAEETGNHLVTVVVGNRTTSGVLYVQGFSIDMQAVPKEAMVGQEIYLVGRIRSNDMRNMPITITFNGEKHSVVTDLNGVFKLTYTPKKAGDLTIAALADLNGEISTAELKVPVTEPNVEKPFTITASVPQSMLAGTTVRLTGETFREKPVNASITLEFPDETDTVNSTGSWSYTFVAPREPGFYPLAIHASDDKGTADKLLTLRVIPFSEALIEVKSDKTAYLPNETANITYHVDLTQPITTTATITAVWYGKPVYEKTETFNQTLTGLFELPLQAGDYEITVETLGKVGKASFQAYTRAGYYEEGNTTLNAPTVKQALNGNGYVSVGILLAVVLGALVLFA